MVSGDRLGFPDAEVLETQQGNGSLRIDRNGWIELTTDGEQMWVEVERMRGGCRVSGGFYFIQVC
jgi:hypothetical protein